MKINKDKEYFLNEDKEIVEIEKYVTGDNPFEKDMYSWGTTLNEAIEGLSSVVDEKTINKLKSELAHSIDEKYGFEVNSDKIDIDTHNIEIEVYNKETESIEYSFPAYYDVKDIFNEIAEDDPNFSEEKYELIPDPNEVQIEVYNKETNDVEYTYPIYWDPKDILDDIIQNEFESFGGGLNFKNALNFFNENNIDISDVFSYKVIEADKEVNPDSYAIVFATDENVRAYYCADKTKDVTAQDKADYLELTSDLMKSYLDCKEYNVNLYNMDGELLFSDSGFIGDDIAENGMEDYVGEVVSSLGEYNSIEECISDIKKESLPSLDDKLSAAESRTDMSNKTADINIKDEQDR